jgi:arylsulfatase A
VSDEFLTTLELLPTLAAAAGKEPPAGLALDGYNMLPILAGLPSPRKEMFWEFRGQKAARIGNYKWLESRQGAGLYDLASDIGEKNDLTEKMPQLAADISARWTQWRQQMDQTEPRGPFRDY